MNAVISVLSSVDALSNICKFLVPITISALYVSFNSELRSTFQKQKKQFLGCMSLHFMYPKCKRVRDLLTYSRMNEVALLEYVIMLDDINGFERIINPGSYTTEDLHVFVYKAIYVGNEEMLSKLLANSTIVIRHFDTIAYLISNESPKNKRLFEILNINDPLWTAEIISNDRVDLFDILYKRGQITKECNYMASMHYIIELRPKIVQYIINNEIKLMDKSLLFYGLENEDECVTKVVISWIADITDLSSVIMKMLSMSKSMVECIELNSDFSLYEIIKHTIQSWTCKNLIRILIDRDYSDHTIKMNILDELSILCVKNHHLDILEDLIRAGATNSYDMIRNGNPHGILEIATIIDRNFGKASIKRYASSMVVCWNMNPVIALIEYGFITKNWLINNLCSHNTDLTSERIVKAFNLGICDIIDVVERIDFIDMNMLFMSKAITHITTETEPHLRLVHSLLNPSFCVIKFILESEKELTKSVKFYEGCIKILKKRCGHGVIELIEDHIKTL